MTLKFSTTGRPMVECINPKCGKIHGIYRKGEYLNRPQIKVVCSSCGTKWILDPSDAQKLKAHYEERKQKNEEKKKQKEENLEPNKIEKTGKEEDETSKEPPKSKKSWIDRLLD